jgi:isovaleryl-CoA dehydrogenase
MCPRRTFSSVSSKILDESSSKERFSSLFNPTDDHLQLRSSLRAFVQREVEPQAFLHNRNETFNRPLFTKLATDVGILGITLPSEYGGCDVSYPATAACIVHEELSYSDPAFCLSYLAHSILLVHNLYANSTSIEQRQRFLPSLCQGYQIGGMGMSEAHGGTDVLGMMKTRAAYQPDSECWILNGSKMWITNGYMMHDEKEKEKDDMTGGSSGGTINTTMTTGDVFLIYANTGPKKTDVTQFLVERGMPGFYVGQKILNKLGMRASPTAGTVSYDNRLCLYIFQWLNLHLFILLFIYRIGI